MRTIIRVSPEDYLNLLRADGAEWGAKAQQRSGQRSFLISYAETFGTDQGLDDMLQRSIAGNAHDDHQLIEDLMGFAMDSRNTIWDRAQAIRHLDQKVMGLDNAHGTNEQVVREAVLGAAWLLEDEIWERYPHLDKHWPLDPDWPF